MIDRETFFASIRRDVFQGRMKQLQVDGCNGLLDVWEERYARFDIRWLAYCLATAYHETAHTMQPVRETLARSDRQARARLENAWTKGRLPQVSKPYWRDGFYGRGYVQLTHRFNYENAQDQLGLGDELTRNPDKVMEPELSARILFSGMIDGWFTKRKLSQFIIGTRKQYVAARQIVNGWDHAATIARTAVAFERALHTVPPEPSIVVDQPRPSATPESGWFAILLKLFLSKFRR